MNPEKRIYNEKVEIDAEKVRCFFEKRFVKDNPLATVMMRGDAADQVAEKRDNKEKNLLLEILDLSQPRLVLDVGCGCGRLASHLLSWIEHYDGLDFTAAYISAAQSLFREQDNLHFHQMSVAEINRNLLTHEYDLVLITGLCLYLNDQDIADMFDRIRKIISPDAQIYLRESVSVIGQRLTLKDFPSEELQTDYNAIYRTPEELERTVAAHWPDLKILSSGFLLDEETGARKETNQKYWLISS